jgi:hypothetical protein
MANPQPVKGPPALPVRASRTGALPPALPKNQPIDPSRFDMSGSQRASSRSVNRQTGRTENVWFSFSSTNVNKAKVDPDYDLESGKKLGTGTITIEFVSGATYEYADRPMSDWYDLITSSSKGRFSYFEVRGPGRSRKGQGVWKPCVQILQAWRSKAEVRAIKAARQPLTAKHKLRTYTRGGQMNAFGKGGKRIRPPTIH